MNIFVGNLVYTATDQDLRQLFELYGVVDTIEVMTDRETGHPCGCGFVEMPERSAARAAIAGLHGTDLGGCACTVNEAYWWVCDREPS
jgi:RNA recognition motif-containing protein